MAGFTNETGGWLEDRLQQDEPVELELGALVAAASDWTEDELELDDLVSGLVESGRIALALGAAR